MNTLNSIFRVRQRITPMVNRYAVHAVQADGKEGPLVAVARHKRMALKEQVRFYADEDRRTPLFSFKARQLVDLGAAYDVLDRSGVPIGSFRKDFARLLLRSTRHLDQPALEGMVGSERGMSVAIVRRLWDLMPVVDAIPFFIPYHFDFHAPDGSRVLALTKKMRVRDSYVLEIFDRRLDWRLAVAQAVALDALQSR
ncbi:hypothetical protein [Thermoactinospora rubra]|uniref:hypothetical protein n=1 Tax=Thermoactinospora rubra TaxID=1088767 RepID=UPI000A10E646|nr:hypothetical protein [Thermoactinospora rubra]